MILKTAGRKELEWVAREYIQATEKGREAITNNLSIKRAAIVYELVQELRENNQDNP